jgi:hypothetical protein
MTQNAAQVIARLDTLNLPKWPQMFVFGESVTSDQAKDIILRTDPFLTDVEGYRGGNNDEWNKWAARILGYAAVADAVRPLQEAHQWRIKDKVADKLRTALGVVDTEYVHNTWASCSYVYGPYGWCHPDGTISYADNIGKWPNAQEVYMEWVRLAATFPYLDLTATLMSGEHSEEDCTPVVSFRARKGEVIVLDEPVLPRPEQMPPARNISAMALSLFNRSREQGLNDSWIIEYGRDIAPMVTKFLQESLDELKANLKDEAAKSGTPGN